MCWRCRRGLSIRLLDPWVERDHAPVKPKPVGQECRCYNPRPQFIPLFGGFECGRCGYKIEKPVRGVQEGL